MNVVSLFSTLLLAVLAMAGGAEAEQKSSGCGKGAGLQSGALKITVNGKQRDYLLRVPNNYNPNTAYRLIFTFHWRGGSMYDAANNAGGYYGLAALARESTIFVSPQGFNAGWANNNGEDIAFVDALVKTLDEKLCVDQTRRFATGFSYGGGMSHSVACSRAGVFRGVSVIAGATLSGCAGGNTPIAYQSIHGVNDNVLPIALGRELRDRFVRVNGCQQQNAPEPASGSGTHIKTEYRGCSAGHPVVYIVHDGGHVAEPADRGKPNFAPDATWSFFSQFN